MSSLGGRFGDLHGVSGRAWGPWWRGSVGTLIFAREVCHLAGRRWPGSATATGKTQGSRVPAGRNGGRDQGEGCGVRVAREGGGRRRRQNTGPREPSTIRAVRSASDQWERLGNTRMRQEQPGKGRNGQDRPGAARTDQDRPGTARRSHEQPGTARNSQEQPGAARSGQEQPEPARRSQDRPGSNRSSQDHPGPARSGQERPGAARNQE